MTVTAGWTAEEIREFVFQYELMPYGSKGAWLAERGVSQRRLARWRDAVHLGDVQRGLLPREDGPMGDSVNRRRVQAHALEAERAAQAAQLAALQARVDELEAVNDALGKAIGLLHQMSGHEPGESPEPTEPPRA